MVGLDVQAKKVVRWRRREVSGRRRRIIFPKLMTGERLRRENILAPNL